MKGGGIRCLINRVKLRHIVSRLLHIVLPFLASSKKSSERAYTLMLDESQERETVPFFLQLSMRYIVNGNREKYRFVSMV